jgi:hypothetical protein
MAIQQKDAIAWDKLSVPVEAIGANAVPYSNT